MDNRLSLLSVRHSQDMHSFEFRDPAKLINEIAQRVPLAEDTAYVALVAHPSTEQRLVTVRQLSTPALIDDYEEAIDELGDVMESLEIPGATRPPSHSVITIVVRPGLCVFGPNEGCWMSAWRYSNHFRDCYDGGVVLVTEHGWSDFMNESAWCSPAMAA